MVTIGFAEPQIDVMSVAETAYKTAYETNSGFKEKPVYDLCKRVFDVVFSFISLVVLAIPLLVIMLVIWVSDGGNPIFVQERVGKDGKTFKMYKLRTMVVGAEAKRDEVKNITDGEFTVLYKPQNDPRITKFGKLLRKTSADEFPQLVNVLKGQMSIVGPRPLSVCEHDEISKYMNRGLVKPGLSCYSILDNRSRNSYENWVNLDLKYIRKRSFLVDLKIIFMTIGVVLSCKNY